MRVAARHGTKHEGSRAGHTSPLFHPTHFLFCTKHWHSSVWRKPARRRSGVSGQLRSGLELCCRTSWDGLALNGLVLFHSHPDVLLPSGPAPGGPGGPGGAGGAGGGGGSRCVCSERCFHRARHAFGQTQHYKRSSNWATCVSSSLLLEGKNPPALFFPPGLHPTSSTLTSLLCSPVFFSRAQNAAERFRQKTAAKLIWLNVPWWNIGRTNFFFVYFNFSFYLLTILFEIFFFYFNLMILIESIFQQNLEILWLLKLLVQLFN